MSVIARSALFQANMKVLLNLAGVKVRPQGILVLCFQENGPRTMSVVSSEAKRTISGATATKTKPAADHDKNLPPPLNPKFDLMDLSGYNPISALYSRGISAQADKSQARNPVWPEGHIETIAVTHVAPNTMLDRVAFQVVDVMKKAWKLISRLDKGPRNEAKWLTHILCMEAMAGVPGMAAALGRHVRSLVTMQADADCFRATLAEVESQRLHTLTIMSLEGAGFLPKMAVLVTQATASALFLPLGLLSPKFCHRVSAYMAEEAVSSYSLCLGDLTAGLLPAFRQRPVPMEAGAHWRLGNTATLQQILLCLRADEAHHRALCHALASFMGRRGPGGAAAHSSTTVGGMSSMAGSGMPSYPRSHHTQAMDEECKETEPKEGEKSEGKP